MKKFFFLKLLHFVYLGLLLAFIAFYFTYYIPAKAHNECVKYSAETTLKTSDSDAYTLYHYLYKTCISK